VAANRRKRLKELPGWGPLAQEAHVIRRRAEEQDDTEQEDTELEMMPMIDITTLLLIFFLVSGIFMLQARIELPEAKTGTPLLESGLKPVVITVRKSKLEPGKVLTAFEDEPNQAVGLDQLVQGYKKRLADGYQPTVVIKAEKASDFGTVRRIMERFADAGVKDLQIGVEEPLR